MQDPQVQSLGKEEMATHSCILAWRIPWTEEPGRLQSMGLQRVGHDSATNTFSHRLYWAGQVKILTKQEPCPGDLNQIPLTVVSLPRSVVFRQRVQVS